MSTHKFAKVPKKQRCVVSKLAESVGLKVVGPSTPSTPPHAHGSALSDDTKRLVHELYQNSNISWQAPGRKDRESLERAPKGEECQEDRAGSVYAHVSQRGSQQVQRRASFTQNWPDKVLRAATNS